jgi:phosphoglycolate phosphatase
MRHLYVFDWDGTLVDSVARIVGSLRRAALELGLEDLGDAGFSDIIGLGLPQAIERLYPALDAGTARQFRDSYATHFVSNDQAPSQFFPHALALLERLRARGHWVAVATGKSRRGLDRVLAELGMQDFFDATRCADETASKPDPRMLFEIFAQLGVAPNRAVLIGDTEYDMDMARRAGAHAVGVGYGVHHPERLARHRPALIIDSLDELLEWSLPG